MNDEHPIIGHWRLVSYLEQGADGQWVPALDALARGSISYWPTGHMQVVMGASTRPRLSGAWADVPAAQKARCLDDMVAYAGTYTVEPDRVLHHVDICWIPNWEGRDLVRLMTFPEPGQLLLATLPDTGQRPRPAQRVLWERTG